MTFTVTSQVRGEETFTAAYGNSTLVEFPADSVYVQSSRDRSKGILVQAEAGKTISVSGVSDEFRSTDGFVAISCDGMSSSTYSRYEYGILSTRQQATTSSPQTYSQFLLIPCEDNTRITITPSQRVSASGRNIIPGVFGPDIARKEKDWTPPTAGQTLMISIPLDLTGSRIRSDKPIVVLSGHQCGEVPFQTEPCDYMVEQIPPHLTWGYNYFLNPLAARESGDVYRVFTVYDNTEVNVTCANEDNSGSPETQTLQTLNRAIRQNWLEFRTQDRNSPLNCIKPFVRKFCSLESSNPVLVAHYSHSFGYDAVCTSENLGTSELGDPFMSLVPPVVQHLNNYTLRAISAVAGDFPMRFLSISVHERFFQPNQIMVNGAPVESNPSRWNNIYCEGGNICGRGIYKPIANNGDLTVYHEMETAALNLHIYGFQQQNSYAIVGGMELEPISGQNHKQNH